MHSPYLTGREKWDRLVQELCDLGDYRGMCWEGKEGRCFCWEKTPATQANYFIQIRRNKCVMFLRSLRIWLITANVSIYKISALVDIFPFQFSTSIPPY